MSEHNQQRQSCRIAVIWVDWYAYHLARFEGLKQAFGDFGQIRGIEYVGRAGVHAGYTVRESRTPDFEIETLEPEKSWAEVNAFRLSLKLWRELSTLNPEAVLVPGYYTLPALVAALWAKSHGRPSVLMTESTEHDHTRTFWKEALKRWIFRLGFDGAVCGGKAHERYLQRLAFHGPIEGFYDVVGNKELGTAADTLRQMTKAADHGLPRDYILFVGRLAEEKNVLTLLQAWRAYRQGGGTFDLVLAGDGPERASLQAAAQISEFGEKVFFLGHRSAEELIPCFAFAQLFVLPSTREPWGLVVNEAMACGLPVIVSSHCGCAEDLVRPAVNGMVFDPTDPVSLAICMEAMERLGWSARAEMGAAGRSHIQSYSPAAFGQAVLRLAERRAAVPTTTIASPSRT